MRPIGEFPPAPVAWKLVIKFERNGLFSTGSLSPWGLAGVSTFLLAA